MNTLEPDIEVTIGIRKLLTNEKLPVGVRLEVSRRVRKALERNDLLMPKDALGLLPDQELGFYREKGADVTIEKQPKLTMTELMAYLYLH